MTNILNKINSLFPISDDTVQVLKENVTCCRFPKKYQLIKADTYCKSAFFIEKGITRSFWLVDGEEVTTSFAGEGSIVFSMDELYYGKISEEYVETLEEVEAYRISLATLTHLFETNIELCNWGRIIHQNEYRRLHRSHKDHLTLSARERYEAFKEQFPDAYRRVNLGYIASYLGIRLSTHRTNFLSPKTNTFATYYKYLIQYQCQIQQSLQPHLRIPNPITNFLTDCEG